MKRFGLWTTAVFAILLVVPISRASAAERPNYPQTVSAMSTSSMTARVFVQAAALSGWTAQDTVEVVGFGILALLGTAAVTNQVRSARLTQFSQKIEIESRQREIASRQREIASEQSREKDADYRQREEQMLNALDDVLAAVDTYLLLRQPGEIAEKSVVRDVFSELNRFQRIADSVGIDGTDEFRRLVVVALTTDLDADAEAELTQVRIGRRSVPVPPDAQSLSDIIHRMAERLRKNIERQERPVERSA